MPTTESLHRQLDALDSALRGIAGVQSVDRVLQLIVDNVRHLVGAKYAALGIQGAFGRIEQFIVSGISPEQRALLGDPPQGHGLLGLIIVFPVLGHGTWHAYRAIRPDQA